MANGILAAILSFFIPGLGQAYAGDIKKGIIFFVVAFIIILLAMLVFKTWIIYILSFIISIYAAYDAYQMAEY